jgi:PAS domain-containing protein
VIAVVSRDEVKFESLVEAALDAMLGVDSLGVILFVNRQTELLFGYDRDTLVGQPFETLVPDSLLMVRPAPGAGFVADPAARATGAGLELTKCGSTWGSWLHICEMADEGRGGTDPCKRRAWRSSNGCSLGQSPAHPPLRRGRADGSRLLGRPAATSRRCRPWWQRQ